jgi:SAM-dependent methyltransferase
MQRLRSFRHRFWYGVSERVRWSRGAVRETPVRKLPALPCQQQRRIAALRSHYQVHFELTMNAATSLNNYEYLDILDRGWSASGLARPAGGTVCDIGCASFWYARTLQCFFSPRRLVGVEIEGHRLFKDGHTRIDHAAGYLAELPTAEFLVADYRRLDLAADVVTAWFPFISAPAILAWRLPLSLLAPEALFKRCYHNLKPGGLLVMVNHGSEEAGAASMLCSAAGFKRAFEADEAGLLSDHRLRPAVLSCWRKNL